MPTTNREMASTKALFFNIGFPGVLGRVEGTHEHIQSPGENAELYRNRRGYFSLNVQVVSNAKLEICDIVTFSYACLCWTVTIITLDDIFKYINQLFFYYELRDCLEISCLAST